MRPCQRSHTRCVLDGGYVWCASSYCLSPIGADGARVNKEVGEMKGERRAVISSLDISERVLYVGHWICTPQLGQAHAHVGEDVHGTTARSGG